MIKQYIILFVERHNSSDADQVLLILKDRPDWQKNRYNIPGGKIEPGESPVDAAIRELKEETGYAPVYEPKLMGTMQDGSHIIYCFKAVIADDGVAPRPRHGETEIVSWVSWNEVLKDSRLIPNLRVIIPLVRSGVENWVIGDGRSERRSGKKPRHVIQISLPTYYEGDE